MPGTGEGGQPAEPCGGRDGRPDWSRGTIASPTARGTRPPGDGRRRVRMLRRVLPLLIWSAFVLGLPPAPRACTTFCVETDDGWIFGRNYDWDVEVGLVVVNKRGVAKRSFVEDDPASWVSRFGSVTFNQYGREMPLGGMNQAGLIVETMWLNEAVYPPADARGGLASLQWVQYQLDTAATVEEVLASDARIRIAESSSSPLHFLVSDAKGGCASVEFLDGEMVAHTRSGMPATCLTNSTYEESAAALGADRAPVEGSTREADRNGSLRRFLTAAREIAGFDAVGEDRVVARAFAVLDSVAVRRTQWRVVYDPGSERIYFRTRSHPQVRFLDAGGFDYACGTPALVLDLAGEEAGEVTDRFVPYTREENLRLIREAFGKTDFLADTPEEVLAFLAAYPDSLPCVN
ncbi:MAG: linear amide C-N hydrolase [Candidatus Eisenbacteria bacterium]|nr:linear amide C-N hydrolase [Candidatus Latescibacterota bacterium]MBD3300822.1 linear amide C-N hydrolase [Candidatus Eisenbacteria bacterium]